MSVRCSCLLFGQLNHVQANQTQPCPSSGQINHVQACIETKHPKVVLLNRIQESAQPDKVGLTTYLSDR